MTTLRNGAESGTADGTTVTAANSAGGVDSGFDLVTIGAGDTLTFSTTQVAHDGHSYKFVPANASTHTAVRWSTAIGAQSAIYGRLYLWTAANPATNAIALFTAFGSSTVRCRFRITTAGKLAVVNAATAVVATSTNSIALSAWNRIEFGFTFSATVGTYTVSLYAGDSTTPVETLSGSAANFGGTTADTFDFITGIASNYGTSPRTYYFDDFQLNTVGLPGPAGITGTVAAPLGSLSTTSTGTPTVPGTASAQLGSLDVTTTGTPTVKATATASLGPLAATTSGTPTVSGAATVALGALTTTGTGLRTTAGAASASLGSLTITAAGTPNITAVVATPLAGLIVTSSGVTSVQATVTITLGPLNVAATGAPAVAGTANSTLGALNVISIGSRPAAGVVVHLGSLALTIAGTVYPVTVRNIVVTAVVRERCLRVNVADRDLAVNIRDRTQAIAVAERPLATTVAERATPIAAHEALELRRSNP